ncbi:MAG: hypothetical protein PHN72_04295 [Bacilli bacterium]|nr:hypothetical protein [Bacilli bacterium]
MNIIMHKNELYHIDTYLKMIFDTPDIYGVMFDISMTNDEQIVVFRSDKDNGFSLKDIWNINYSDIKSKDIITLSELLEHFEGKDKKLLLNILPLCTASFTEKTLAETTMKNNTYIYKIRKILEKQENKNISLVSTDARILHHLKSDLFHHKLGLFMTGFDLTYDDVDIYIFPVHMYKKTICEQQMALEKEVMLLIEDEKDMEWLAESLEDDDMLPKGMMASPRFSFITNHPVHLKDILN